MAKKIKFPLKMADGAEVRTLEELKEHFDAESIVGYFSDGRLLNWLRARYYDDEADKVEQLTAGDSQLHKKICEIFGVESEEEIDPEEIARRQERLNRLKQYTDDRDILERVDQVAFDQEDLGDLLDEDATLIYLCNNRFTIPLRETHKTYVGIGKAVAVIRSNKIVDFDALNIEFKKVLFDDNYDAILKEYKKTQTASEEPAEPVDNLSRAKKLYEEGKAAEGAEDYEIALKKYKQAAGLDYAEAFNSIGAIYYFGNGVSQNVNEAFHWFKRGMEKNDGNSFAWYAHILINEDEPTESDKREAFRCFKRATELIPDNGSVWCELGRMYRNGNGTRQNLAEAFSCFKQGHKLGHSQSAVYLGIMFSDGEHVAQNPRKGFEFFQKAFELDNDNISAIKTLASCYRFGDGVAKNSYKAFELYKRAAEMGNVEAMTITGVMLLNGEGTREDTEQFFYWTKRAADNGDSTAMSNLGYHFLNNIGDYRKAFDLYERAANAGHTGAINNLGLMYFNGQGVREDRTRAFNWFLKSAESGDFNGMANVGFCYLWGEGTSKDLWEAERWCKKSAEGGNINGMENYADCLYEKGNVRAAINWYERAANEGSESAKERLDEIRNEMQQQTSSSYSSSQSSGGVWEATTTIRNRQGMHARPASVFVQKASSFKSKVQLKAKGKTCDAKSILMIMSMGLEYGDQVTIAAEGPDARQAVNDLRNLIDSRFGE